MSKRRDEERYYVTYPEENHQLTDIEREELAARYGHDRAERNHMRIRRGFPAIGGERVTEVLVLRDSSAIKYENRSGHAKDRRADPEAHGYIHSLIVRFN